MLRKVICMYGLFSVMAIWVVAGIAFGQDAAVTSAPDKLYEVGLKLLFPALWTVGGPWLTGWITSGLAKVPATFQIVITSVLSAIIGGIAGVIPDFPLTVESAAEMAGSGGAVGQILSNMHSKTLHPKVGAADTGK